jgi:hypothetical protein
MRVVRPHLQAKSSLSLDYEVYNPSPPIGFPNLFFEKQAIFSEARCGRLSQLTIPELKGETRDP